MKNIRNGIARVDTAVVTIVESPVGGMAQIAAFDVGDLKQLIGVATIHIDLVRTARTVRITLMPADQSSTQTTVLEVDLRWWELHAKDFEALLTLQCEDVIGVGDVKWCVSSVTISKADPTQEIKDNSSEVPVECQFRLGNARGWDVT